MAKIKKVTIENFRAYEGIHDFSFIGTNGLANLVVVYAPNGYGKTSFFDAVEWAFSNKIRRFENGVLKQELDSKDFASDDQIILTNRAAYYKGGKGEITITTDEDKIIKRTVIPRQIPNTEIKNDYRDVPLLGNYTQEDINLFSENNMLTQDQIDSFLRFKSPEEKFNALREFWPEGSEASLVFSTLTSYSRILRGKADDVQHKITEIEGKIDKNINSETNFSKINKWILEFNAETLTDIKFPVISKDIDDDVYLGIIQSNETYKLIVEGQFTNAGNTAIKFNSLSRLHPDYLLQVSEISASEKRLSELRKTVIKLEKIRLLRESNSSKSPELKRLNAEKLNWERMISLWPEFSRDKAQLQSIKADIYRSYQEIEEKTGYRTALSEEIGGITTDRNQLAADLEQEQAIASKIEVLLKQIDKLRTDIREGLNHQQFSESCIADIARSALNTYHDRNLVTDMLENEEFSKYETGNIEVNHYINLLAQRQRQLREMIDMIVQMENEMEQKGSFSENLNRLVKWATHQVALQQISSCPMCNTTFKDVGELLDAISSEKGDILMVSDLERNLESYTLIKSYLQEEVLEAESYLYLFFTTELSRINLEIDRIEDTIEKFESTIRKDQDAIDHASIVINQIIEQISPNSDFIDSSDVDLNEIKANNKESITNLTVRLKEQNDKLNIKTNEFKALSNTILVLQNAVASQGNKVSLLQAKETYIECTALLEKLLLGFEDLDLSILERELQSCLASITLESGLINDQLRAIAGLEGELKEVGNLLTEVEANEQVAEAELQLAVKKREKENFESNYRALIQDGDLSLKSIQEQSNYFQTRQQNLLLLKARLDAFGIDLAIIEADVVRNRLQKELSILRTELKKTQLAAKRIDASKGSVGDFITRGVDQYFNKDVINQIYSKIEPHPKLTEIDIRAESTGRLPRLTIRAKSDSEELAPGLFLSTGQVNVLSLSIFIARAYEMGNGNFNCIFMDDPVQNMSDINVLSFVDLLRILIMDQDRQVMISTHDEKFFRLLKNKLSPDFFKSKFIELGSYGKLKEEIVI